MMQQEPFLKEILALGGTLQMGRGLLVIASAVVAVTCLVFCVAGWISG